ncbi:MAG TPA: hypothetical protein DEA22_14320 [Blastocatellia bacterium]|nr:hypothetical protein [Blastocatellia bacterium]
MKAMILAAGFGTRLFPLTIDRTKPAIPFLGKPLVGYVAQYIAGHGITDVIVNLHHQPESVIDALGDGRSFGVNIEYTREEPEILGTAGALDNARSILGDDTFLVINGKIISDIDITKAIQTHRKSGALATMVLKPNRKNERFTIVETKNGLVTGFGGFPGAIGDDRGTGGVPMMFTGIHILEPAVFDYIPRNCYSDIVPVFYRPAIEKGENIAAHISNGTWYELSTIPRYLDISLAMMTGGDVYIGENCTIPASAVIKDSVLWDNVQIGESVHLFRSVIGDGVVINDGENLRNVAVVRAEMVKRCREIPEKSLPGEFRGDNYIVPLGVVQ